MYVSYVWIITTALAIATVGGQFPKVCIGNVSLSDSVCCPVPPGHSEPCGGPGFGSCQPIPAGPVYQPPAIPPWLKDDPRLDWPRRYFKNACSCEGHRDGFQCQFCKFGYQGDDCTKKKPASIRRNALTLNAAEREHVVKAFDKAKRTPSEYVSFENRFGIDDERRFVTLSVYDFLVHLHYLSTKNAEVDGQPKCIVGKEIFSGRSQSLDFGHNGSGFLTWHRLYLLLMERELGQLTGDPFFALPYWNWADDGLDCPVCRDDLAGATNWSDPLRSLQSGSPFSNWTTACQLLSKDDACVVYPCDLAKPCGPVQREPGGSVSTSLPTTEDVVFTLSQATFDLYPFTPAASQSSFRNCLEGFGGPKGVYRDNSISTMHVQVHAYFGGTISQVSSSPDDPLFFFHHTYIDKLFEVWLRMYNATTDVFPPNVAAGHNLHDFIVPFFPMYKHEEMFTQSYALGYDYDTTEEMQWVQNSKKLVQLKKSVELPASSWAMTTLVVIAAVSILCVAFVILVTSSRVVRNQPRTQDQTPLLGQSEYTLIR